MEPQYIWSVWLISFSIMSGVLHVVASQYFISFYGQVILHCRDIPHFVFLLSVDGYLDFFPLFGAYQLRCCEH